MRLPEIRLDICPPDWGKGHLNNLAVGWIEGDHVMDYSFGIVSDKHLIAIGILFLFGLYLFGRILIY